MITPELREKCVNTIRFLAADAVQKANSGHPGMPMGSADIAFVLWSQFLRYNPDDPQWENRDRFVLSAGHASALLYSLLHLTGYNLPLDELKQFRQWNSITPGHPEYGLTPGVECTTGPLGAGFGNAVGMALASKMLGARFNTADTALIEATVYVLCSDGDMQEGVSSESASFAGHLGLGNLIVTYDSNHVTIGGELQLSMSEDVGQRFKAYGWHVQKCDGHDYKQLEQCLTQAKEERLRPSLIIAETTIGKGAPTKAGKSSVHGSPLGEDELHAAKQAVGWPIDQNFHIPDEVKDFFETRKQENLVVYKQWHEKINHWKTKNAESAQLWHSYWARTVPENLLKQLIDAVQGKEDATRNLSGMVIQKAAELLPFLVGGSADLEPSNQTLIKSAGSIKPSSTNSHQVPDPAFIGRNIHFGIREHAMGSICNGLYLFGGFRPYCGTFSVFSDYMRPSIRLAALSKIPGIFIFTHDSFWVGEDGPTHQPIEQTWALRIIPELEVWRPADALETAAAWAYALTLPNGNTPQALLLTRQNTESLTVRENFDPVDIWKGAYTVRDCQGGDPAVVLVSTGSEGGAVQMVRNHLENMGIQARHVSMPCVERFLKQPENYRQSLLPSSSKIIVVEAGVSLPWYRFADYVIGKDTFGHSAPGKELSKQFGFTAELLTENIKSWLDFHGFK